MVGKRTDVVRGATGTDRRIDATCFRCETSWATLCDLGDRELMDVGTSRGEIGHVGTEVSTREASDPFDEYLISAPVEMVGIDRIRPAPVPTSNMGRH